ncbi:MAG: hypothetical protein WA650_08215, partial [Bradyrhizobium sp.]
NEQSNRRSGGIGANFLGRDMPRSKAAQRAGFKVLENKRFHDWGHLAGSPIVAALCGNLNPIHMHGSPSTCPNLHSELAIY